VPDEPRTKAFARDYFLGILRENLTLLELNFREFTGLQGHE